MGIEGTESSTTKPQTYAIEHDLGEFEGFNFRHDGAIYPNQTAEEVVNWDHDARGEAEFWPAGDHPGVALLFDTRTDVTGSDLLTLDTLLAGLSDDGLFAFVRLHYLVNVQGYNLADLDRDQVEDFPGHVFPGSNFLDLRKEAAYELFELYYPEEYRVWEKSTCDGLSFDVDRFLDSPSMSTHELTYGDQKVLIVVAE